MKILIILLIIDAIVGFIASIASIRIKKSSNKIIDDFVTELKETESNKNNQK